MSDERSAASSSLEEAIFSGALDLVAGLVREAYLDRSCADDPALRARVGALLRAHEALGRLGEKPGDQFGPYILLEKIGQGAFGSVWRARQEQPLRREVALKLINLGMDTRQVLLRFEAERQVLALLEHENIAKIFDAGASDQGRPYFVMELVRGPKITDYCDQNNLSTPARLLLFAQVCRALHYAHDKGVIHRDIKPSNILVSEYRGVPTPKIIDFGIAKATGQRLTEATLHTAPGQVMGTLSYMSPEQTAMGGAAIDARSDVYSLGALLYELLIGRPPVTEAEFQGMFFDEVVRTIRKKHAPRPSERLAALPAPERAALARRHDTVSAKLAALLSRDLDWVTVRCLEKNPRHRYQNAGELADRLARHLDDRPAADTGFRIRHWLRRHELALGLAGIAAVLIVLLWHWRGTRPAAWKAVPIRVSGHPRLAECAWRKIDMNGQNGWLVGGYDEGSATGKFLGQGVVLHTWNGGRDWQEVALTNSDAGAGTIKRFIGQKWDGIGPVYDLQRWTDYQAHGAAVTNVVIATVCGIFSSTNMLGPHPRWARLTPPPDGPDGYAIYNGLVQTDSGRELYAYGWQGIAHWERGGRWEVQFGAYQYCINGLWVADKWRPDVWAVSGVGEAGAGGIYHLNGPGGRWEQIPLAGVKFWHRQELRAIKKIDRSGDIIAVGDGGLILRSRMAGASRIWDSFEPVRQNLNCVTEDQQGILWVAGNDGVLLKSSDNGDTWETRPFLGADGRPITDNLLQIHFEEHHRAWVLGSGDQNLYECDAP